MKRKINLPTDVKFLLDELHNANFEAYIVGGCVRDSLLGKEPHDWDICTNALPEQIMEVFKNFKVLPTGLKHGTVTVRYHDESYEITTYRIDGNYSDGRHPDSVEFTSDLKKDLSRRDFTINAMAYDGKKIVDYFDGLTDLKFGTIRCVGNPDERFLEDALRIMRAVRFSSVLNFNISFDTISAMYRGMFLLKQVSAERIQDELRKTLNANYISVDNFKLLCDCLKEYTNHHMSINDDYKKFVQVSDEILRLCIISKICGTALAEKLKFDKKTIYFVDDILNTRQAIQTILPTCDNYKYFARKLLYNLTDWIIRKALELCKIYDKDNYVNYCQFADLVCKIANDENECYKISQLKITGDDIMNSCSISGKRVGQTLDYLLSLVMKEQLENKNDILIEKSIEYNKEITKK